MDPAVAELTGRVCYGLEQDAKYVDVIIGRWQKATGQKARLDGIGATFQEVQSQRRKPAGEAAEEDGLAA